MENVLQLQTQSVSEIPAFQANAGIKFHLFGSGYIAAFEVGDKPAAGGGTVSDIAFAILPDPEQASDEECSISEMCSGLNELVQGVTEDASVSVFNESDISGAINEYASDETKDPAVDADLKIKFRQLFLYIHKCGDTLDVEYALSISMDLKDFGLSLGNIISMDSVWVSIWNTKNNSILSKMEINGIDKLIADQS